MGRDETVGLSDAKINFPKNVPKTLKRHTRYIEDYFLVGPSVSKFTSGAKAQSL